MRFPYLEGISLDWNKIESIEGFNRIYLPALQSLHFGENRINEITDVRKGYWPNLVSIGLSKHIKMKVQIKSTK